MRAINQALAELKREKRQLFVTRSPVLARHVESNFRGLVDSANIANKTPEELVEMARSSENRSAPALVEFDSEVDLRKDLPSRFSLLTEAHFPLFISFEKLCSLIEADLLRYEKLKRLWKQQDDLITAKEALELEETGRVVLEPPREPFRDILLRQRDHILLRLIDEKKYIGYSDFKERYWPQFKRIYGPEVTPTLAYSEILGVIKGSSESLSCPKQYLSRDQYLSGMVRRVSAQLDLDTREDIYTIFRQYKKLAGVSFELNVADRMHCLLDFVNDINDIKFPDPDPDPDSDSGPDHDSDPDYDHEENDGDDDPNEQEESRTSDQEDTGPKVEKLGKAKNPYKQSNDYEVENPTRKHYKKLIKKIASYYQEP
ncbi:unnamed protein product, partial [Rhizoctonia solani]